MTIKSMNVTEVRDGKSRKLCLPRKLKKRYAAFILVILAIGLSFAIYFITKSIQKAQRRSAAPDPGDEGLVPPDPAEALPPSESLLRFYKRGAVCTDGPPCSQIGSDVLAKNGSAVDATIAAAFCNGLVNMQSMGMGGGFLMTVYIQEEGKAYSVNAREMAPGQATEDMYLKDPKLSLKGPLAIGIPGEVRGLWAAHQKWGKLPWADLIEPSIDICRHGYNMSKAQWDSVRYASYIKSDSNLRSIFYDEEADDFKTMGSLIHPSKKTCRTLAKIAEKGGDELYNGTLAEEFAADLKMAGSIITLEDLNQYQANISDAIDVDLPNGIKFWSVPPPGAGSILGLILNILEGYNFNESSLNGITNTILTYHRIVEAFKFAYARRTKLGDTDFVDIGEFIGNLTSQEYADNIREDINDNKTFSDPAHYGAEFFNQHEDGTAHISVLAPNGDAVSVTSTINNYFGAGWSTRQTGILMNSGMDDFSSKFLNLFGLPGSPANKIEPYKRAMSSMSPSILVDSSSGENRTVMVIGAAGGTKITTAVALVIARWLWLGQSIKEAVDAPRFHHQVTPMEISYEYGMLEDVVDGLKSLGHKMDRYRDRGSVICALTANGTDIIANADYRKGGDVFGLN